MFPSSSSQRGGTYWAKAEFDKWANSNDDLGPKKSQLDGYLEESRSIHKDPNIILDALDLRKSNTVRLSILLEVACNIHSIPMSIVVGESAFNARGRVLGKSQNSFKPETVKASVCYAGRIGREHGMDKPTDVCINLIYHATSIIIHFLYMHVNSSTSKCSFIKIISQKSSV